MRRRAGGIGPWLEGFAPLPEIADPAERLSAHLVARTIDLLLAAVGLFIAILLLVLLVSFILLWIGAYFHVQLLRPALQLFGTIYAVANSGFYFVIAMILTVIFAIIYFTVIKPSNDTANNALNILKGMGIEIVANPFFTSTTNWWGISDTDNGLRWVWREKPKFREHNTEDTLTATYSGYMRYAVGWTDPRAVYGSNI